MSKHGGVSSVWSADQGLFQTMAACVAFSLQGVIWKYRYCLKSVSGGRIGV